MAACGSLGRGYGEIGRHARFRFWCRKAWEFKSLYPHQDCRQGGQSAGICPVPSLFAPFCLVECFDFARRRGQAQRNEADEFAHARGGNRVRLPLLCARAVPARCAAVLRPELRKNTEMECFRGSMKSGNALKDCTKATSGTDLRRRAQRNPRLSEHGRDDMKVRTCRLSKRSLKG